MNSFASQVSVVLHRILFTYLSNRQVKNGPLLLELIHRVRAPKVTSTGLNFGWKIELESTFSIPTDEDGGTRQDESEQTWSPRRKHCSVALNGKVLVLGGFVGDRATGTNDVWSYVIEENSWKCTNPEAGWSERDGHCAVVFEGSVFVIGGTNDPYSCMADVKSEDGGRRWREMCAFAPWPERWQHSAVVHEDRIFVLGGWGGRYFNDVWSSSDGLHWIQECSSAPWKARMFHCSVSINGSMYVIGGSDGKEALADVWASSDRGKSWTQVCHSAPWEGRQGHTCTVLDNEVYLLGGCEGSGQNKRRRNDIWKSKDCSHWVKVSNSAAWCARQGHSCVSWDGALYMCGGWAGEQEGQTVKDKGYLNDLYRWQILLDQPELTLCLPTRWQE